MQGLFEEDRWDAHARPLDEELLGGVGLFRPAPGRPAARNWSPKIPSLYASSPPARSPETMNSWPNFSSAVIRASRSSTRRPVDRLGVAIGERAGVRRGLPAAGGEPGDQNRGKRDPPHRARPHTGILALNPGLDQGR
ncbi:MAG: hypothetical protein MZV64_52900 [Ignavibacteriales bacterium]|nr:hypothetical protein [Ignavibacteriales bacterium]